MHLDRRALPVLGARRLEPDGGQVIGTSVGPFRIRERLGAGGMGEVYLAEDSRLRRQVALKRLTDRTLDSTEGRARILREARAAAKLHHPAVATVFDVVEAADDVWIVMEYVEGETLAARLERGQLPLATALDLGVQIAEGVAAAHAHGVLHCDLKPLNIHLTPAGVAKILDFGLAQRPAEEVASDETRMTAHNVSGIDSRSTRGTPGYMAPERLSGVRPDARSDIYSLGVVLFELLTGRRPFAGPDLVAIAAMALTTPAPAVSSLVPDIPAPLNDAIARALASDPAARFQGVDELVETLRACRDGRAPRRRSRVGVAIAAAAGVLVLLAAGMGLRGWWPAGVDGVSRRAGVAALVVKPFANLSGDVTNDYLGVGIADNLTTKLAALPHVTVMSRATTAAYLADHPNSATLARDLGAQYIVDGGVARSGDRLNVTITLLQPDGAVAWAREYTGGVEGLFALQENLARGVAGGLNLVLTPDDRDALAARPTDNVEAFADYSQGQVFLDRRDVEGNVDRAVTLFEQALRKAPEFADAHAGLASAYWQKYVDTKDAAWTIRAINAGLDAVRFDPAQANAHVALATIYNGLGRTPAAIEELEAALARQPNHDDAHRLLGDIYAADGRIDDAVAAFDRAIAIRPSYWQNHNRLAVALMRAGRFVAATASLRRVTELQPDSALGFNNLGAVALMEGDLTLARTSLERGIAIEPRYSNLSNLGTIHYFEGRFGAARDAYERALAIRPDDMGLHRNLGDALARLGDGTEARREYTRALELADNQLRVNPRDAPTLALVGLLEAKLGRKADARTHVDAALDIAPSNSEILYRSAVVAALAGEHDRALAAFKDALAQGYSAALADRDPDLQTLNTLPEFRALLPPRTPRQ